MACHSQAIKSHEIGSQSTDEEQCCFMHETSSWMNVGAYLGMPFCCTSSVSISTMARAA